MRRVLEVDIGFMCSCSLALPAFFDQYLPKCFGFSHYFSKFSTYFGSSKDQNSAQDDTKRLNNSEPWGPKDTYRKVDSHKGPVTYAEPYYGNEMSVRGGNNVTPHANVDSWPPNGIVKTVELQHTYPLSNQSPV
jgi:hypothetical protein